MSGLATVRLVSKAELKNAHETKLTWINNEKSSLKEMGCKTFQEAINFIENNKNLYSANLSEFKDLTNDDLKKLQDCTWIQHLLISSNQISDNGLKFLNRMLLKSVEFKNCIKLTDNSLEFLKHMPLISISFSGCDRVTDNALEHLKGMQLQSVNFSKCPLLTDNALKCLTTCLYNPLILVNAVSLQTKHLNI